MHMYSHEFYGGNGIVGAQVQFLSRVPSVITKITKNCNLGILITLGSSWGWSCICSQVQEQWKDMPHFIRRWCSQPRTGKHSDYNVEV